MIGIIEEINTMADDIIEYFHETRREYNVPHMTIEIFTVTGIGREDIQYVLNHAASVGGAGTTMMTSRLYPLVVNSDADNPEAPLMDLGGTIYMSYQNLFSLILQCNMEYDSVIWCMKFLICHEIGHVVACKNRYVGKPVRVWFEYCEEVDPSYENLKALRKNASLKSMIAWSIKYNFEIANERNANNAVGITHGDVEKYVRLTSQGRFHK